MKQLRFAVVAFASILAACGGDPGTGSSSAPIVGTTGDSGDGDLEPMGTFESSGTTAGETTRMVLMADGTAHVEVVSICQAGALSCEPAIIDGLYKRTTGPSGLEHLDLFDKEGVVLGGYDYRYDGQALAVLLDGATEWQSLEPAPAWCASATQCELQWLPQPLCTGQWACVDSGCQFQCSGRAIDLEP